MESPSEQEKPEGGPAWVRPPLVEMLYGIAVFVFVLSVFVGAVNLAFAYLVKQQVPALTDKNFFEAIEDPQFENAFGELRYNGDLIAITSLISGLIGVVVLLLSVYAWKKRKTATFLGLHAPTLKDFLKWTGIFVVVLAALEGVAMLVPSVETDFVKDVVGSSTNFLLLLAGSALLPAVFEELLIRGLLMGSLRHLLDKHVAVAICAAVFTLMHMQYTWVPLVVLIFPLGVVLGYARVNSGSIWVPIFLHLANNAVALSFPQLP